MGQAPVDRDLCGEEQRQVGPISGPLEVVNATTAHQIGPYETVKGQSRFLYWSARDSSLLRRKPLGTALSQ